MSISRRARAMPTPSTAPPTGSQTETIRTQISISGQKPHIRHTPSPWAARDTSTQDKINLRAATMDIKNPYESPVTFNLHRAEYLLGFGITIALMVVHFTEINWITAMALFLYIDLIGYIPGAIAYRRSADRRISKIYYILYITMHSLITCTVVVGLWLWLFGPEWALLAVPFHVFGDRGVFGNF